MPRLRPANRDTFRLGTFHPESHYKVLGFPHMTAFAPAAIALGDQTFVTSLLFSSVGEANDIPRLDHAAVGHQVANFDTQAIQGMEIKMNT